MDNINDLKKFIGTFQGQYSLWLDPKMDADVSESILVISSKVKEKFYQFDYYWKADNINQEGTLLVGFDTNKTVVKAIWLDSWHTGWDYMNFQGYLKEDESKIVLNGFYAVSKGPDWGWKISIDFSTANSLDMVMFNITPEGQESIAVQVNYKPM